ncbi:paraquat-inducible protein A [Tropicibacter naphthalenivorans]|uniref:Paraquat-inducible protein A n=1 Tax=Tropicibacter naphthalenivorans TaxID=441103 RepID=A0A0P1GHD1_9RHOB|nr:paraquat-inducible protein A [Tropicibacter naphthalenivorans]CUH81085.1 Paraquat-inducible protein A [Tropicibacter naphthalenivorans]SMC97047.1 paraquat-inducible protein A [Tropicibacter naphthalenivorans]
MTTARQAGLVACRACARVWPMGHETCDRCGSRLRSREGKSLQRVMAWWVVGMICYIPANLYPMLVTETLVASSRSTIVGGAIEIAHHGEVLIAAIVLIASVLIPVGKFAAIAYLAITVSRGSRNTPLRRQHIYEIVEFIGRWSMIDVFVVAILSALVQLSVVASIHPGPAALTFALSVIFTMLSAKSFDTRLIWDTPTEQGPVHP